MTTEEILTHLLQEVVALPQLPTSEGLFAPTNQREIMLPFFQDALRLYGTHTTIRARLDSSNLSGTPREVYWRLNESRHPVRNGMVLLGAGLLHEITPTKDGKPWPRIRDLPLAEQDAFRRWLASSSTPSVDAGKTEQDGYWPHDYQHWKTTFSIPSSTG